MNRIFTAILISFITAVVVSPIIIFLARKLKARQNIYEYVDMHKSKQGTPTMGGVGILIALIIGSVCCFTKQNHLACVTLIITLCFGILGFLDDFLKIVHKENLGLRAYQKIIGQLAIAIIVTIFAYRHNFIGTEIYLPFCSKVINLGWWFIPFCLFVFLATVNAVNLTDGLDGLAGGVSLTYLIGFVFVCYLVISRATGVQVELKQEQLNLLVVGGAGIGALLGYLLYNSFPALIFMGDTGSLALGGLISCLAIFLKQPLLIVILGLCFVFSALSVVLQVVFFKITKKRIFLMAPFHHHLEKKGLHESKIVVIYIVTTTILCVGGILLTLIFA